MRGREKVTCWLRSKLTRKSLTFCDYWPSNNKILDIFESTLPRPDHPPCLFWSVTGTIPSLFSCRWNLASGWWLRKIQSFLCYLGEQWWCSCPWGLKVHLDTRLIPQRQSSCDSQHFNKYSWSCITAGYIRGCSSHKGSLPASAKLFMPEETAVFVICRILELRLLK